MKALILAAGFGTRLAPQTHMLPKPLFPVAGKVMLDRTISRLVEAGVDAIMINTHHLHKKIEDHVNKQQYPVRVQIRFEPQILGTGGAIKNISDFFPQDPLMVINADILTDIDLSKVYRFHISHSSPVTMVLHDHPVYNCVSMNQKGGITEFGTLAQPPEKPGEKTLAYTGIQVIDPSVVKEIPADTFSDIIAVYKGLLSRQLKITGYLVQNHSWHDIGSPLGFRNAVLEHLVPLAYSRLSKASCNGQFEEIRLTGDGSDRKWSRLKGTATTMILADHGITNPQKKSETASFIQIGRHLAAKKIPVPRLLASDLFSGLVVMEDLGDENLQSQVIAAKDSRQKIALYEKVIDQLLLLSTKGPNDFDPKWTCQTERYDRELILEKECRYFIEAFINGYLGLGVEYQELQREFEILAALTMQHTVWGLIHRDCQSRNIMWHQQQCYFIDFQGARLGPIQYDLASLLIDPYVALDEDIQSAIEQCYDQKLTALFPQWDGKWQEGYTLCRLTRNLQILGAFGYLSNVKKKSFFAQFIPTAIASLKKTFRTHPMAELTKLTDLINQIPSIHTHRKLRLGE